MSDDKKKKKLDAKRVALKQPHEVRYILKQAKLISGYIDAENKHMGLIAKQMFSTDDGAKYVSNSTLKKLMKAIIKALD